MLKVISSGLEEGLEPLVEWQSVLVSIEQSELIEPDRTESETLCVALASGGHLPVRIEDRLEVRVEV